MIHIQHATDNTPKCIQNILQIPNVNEALRTDLETLTMNDGHNAVTLPVDQYFTTIKNAHLCVLERNFPDK
jgi:hypothetical protein